MPVFEVQHKGFHHLYVVLNTYTPNSCILRLQLKKHTCQKQINLEGLVVSGVGVGGLGK